MADPRKPLFDAIRTIAGRGLTQGEVDRINAILNGDLVEPESTFDRALAVLLRHEGGFANHPSDPGGATMLGVTKATWEGWTGKPATIAEIRALTVDDVKPLYRKRYWEPVQGDRLPASIALHVFDFGVNAGPARAVRYLQGLVGARVDGIMGPETQSRLAVDVAKHGEAELVRRYSEARRSYYRQLKTFNTFGKGWLRRVAEVEAEALQWV